MQSKEHWEQVYATKATDGVSWYQEHATTSLRMIQESGAGAAAAIIDVGGGSSTLADDLLANGFANITVLDLSHAALLAAQKRLGPQAHKVSWMEADIICAAFAEHTYDIWHDRAVFHFLINEADRIAYRQKVLCAVKPGGHVIVATFAEDGPTQCSGLPVMRYSTSQLQAELGEGFALVQHCKEAHHTPAGSVQHFTCCLFRKAVS